MLFWKRRVTAAAVCCFWFSLCPGQGASENRDVNDVALTLRQAIALTLERNPGLSAYSHEIRALSARVVQAGLKPNPELTFDSENFNPGPIGSLGWSRFLESTLQISQLVELGNKRKLRVQAARADQEVAARQLLEHQGELVFQVSHAFLAVVSAQERSSNRQKLLDLAEKTREAVASRVAAGTVSPIEDVRSEAQLGLARLEREKSRLEEMRARDRLAAFWNGSGAELSRVSAAFRIPSEFLARGRQTVGQNPSLAVSEAQIDASRAAAVLEQAYRLPDLTVGGGLRYLNEPGGAGLAASLSIPLPFRDFRSEPRVSQETFALFLNQYRYDATPFHAKVEETLEEEGYVREKVVFDAAYGGERMAAYLFLPKKGSPPFQTMVLFPGSDAIHTRSSASLAPDWSLFVLKSGRALLLPVYKSTYERGDGLASDYPDETSNWKDHVVMWGKDLRRSIDYLETRRDIDSARLAYLGYSWGAAMGPIMMAVEPRLKMGILVVAGLNFQRALPEVDEVHYAPRVKIPVLMLNGKYDFFFPYETSQLPFFELLGTPRARKKLVVHETSHSFPGTDLARESLAWLDEHLGPPTGRP